MQCFGTRHFVPDCILMTTRERRLDEHIRELCARLVVEEEPDELRRTIIELQAALHEHIERLRQMVAASLCGRTVRRRSRNTHVK